MRMFRITTQRRGLITTVTLDGRLLDSHIEEVHRVMLSLEGQSEFKLGDLETCSDAAVQELRHWLGAGTQLKSATPFLRMLLTMQTGVTLPHMSRRRKEHHVAQ
jgi:hypothetical protein